MVDLETIIKDLIEVHNELAEKKDPLADKTQKIVNSLKQRASIDNRNTDAIA